jgi:hypothetical protein
VLMFITAEDGQLATTNSLDVDFIT